MESISSTARELIQTSLNQLERWIEEHEYKGYEPFDGLSSYLRIFTFENLFLQRLLQQLIRQSPINLRPIAGVSMKESTKGRGYVTWGYLNRFQETSDDTYKARALRMLEWLDECKSPLYENHSWGNHFHYASRGGTIPIHEPTIVWTSLIGNVFIDAYEAWKVPRHLEVIQSVAKWILALPKEITDVGTCLSYVHYTQRSIHNSNMLGAAFLARAAELTGNQTQAELAHDAMKYSCAGQLQGGEWYYGEDPMYHWVDSFHTGYNLDSLKRYIAARGDSEFQENLEKGYQFFRSSFIEEDGCPKYYWDRKYPIDIQCAAQIIDTLCLFSGIDDTALSAAANVAQWTISNMQGRDGHFYYRRYPLGIISRAPMIHWGQGTMYKALSNLLRYTA